MAHIHFIGIGGAGMSALAIIAKQKGHTVTGSDENVYYTDTLLKKHHIAWQTGFKAENLKPKPDMVVVSAAYDEKNPELKAAIDQKLPIKTFSEMLAELMKDYRGIAVAGIHGKTTTTAMIAFLLESARLSPSFLIGCREALNFGVNARVGDGEWFVAEADEYKKAANDETPKFLDLKPEIVVITSIEHDHPDIFPTVEDVYRAFYRLACRVPRHGWLVGDIDSSRVKKLALSLADRKLESYGFTTSAAWRIVDYQIKPGRQVFTILHNKQLYGPFQLQQPGKHNIANATAAIIVCLKIGVRLETIQKFLPQFKGTERRFQILGERRGVLVIDDYAHHPTAIQSTLEGARAFYPNRKIWCVFQPHTYSRTKALLNDFGPAFENADRVIIADIYASAREKSGRIHAKHLVAQIKQHHENVDYIGAIKEIPLFLEENVADGDMIIVMGAGDVYKVGQDFLALKSEHHQVTIPVQSKE